MKTSTTKKTNVIPPSFQGILWSVNVKNLDLKRDKIYIIHQVLMYGDLNEISWLFKTYSKKEVEKVFKEAPMQIYDSQSFNFVKNIILDLKKQRFPFKKYVTTPY